jgi:hypothetical protein
MTETTFNKHGEVLPVLKDLPEGLTIFAKQWYNRANGIILTSIEARDVFTQEVIYKTSAVNIADLHPMQVMHDCLDIAGYNVGDYWHFTLSCDCCMQNVSTKKEL